MRVSKIGFGGIPIQRLSTEEAVRVIRRALDLGVDWIDTAHGYSTSEEMIGQAVRGRDRSRLKIFTKGPGKNPDELSQQVEASFRRLGVEWIDLYQFHLVNSPEEWRKLQDNGSLDLLLRLKAEGRIRHVGASAHTREAALAVIEHPEIEVLQYPFSFFREKEGGEIAEACRKAEVGFIAMKPFEGGMLDDAAACIRFLMQFPNVATDPGFETEAEVEEVVRIAGGPPGPTAEDRAAMERLREELGGRFCRRCGYCGPCEQGVQIITLMTMEMVIKLLPMSVMIHNWAGRGAATIEKCTECGVCETRCPYSLSIMERIRVGAEVFRKARDAYLEGASS